MTFVEDPGRRPDPSQASGRRDDDEEEDRLGIFRSWRSLYVTVVVYTSALVILLYLVSRFLDFSA